MLRAYVSEESTSKWPDFVPFIAAAIRAMPNRSTGYTPNMMMLGAEVLMPIDLVFPPDTSSNNTADTITPSSYLLKLQEKLVGAHQTARGHLKGSMKYQKKSYDTRSWQTIYSPGDLVLVFRSHNIVGKSRKLCPIWDGPFLVEDVLSPLLVKVKKRRRSSVIHHDHVKPYKGLAIPHWLRRIRDRILANEESPSLDADPPLDPILTQPDPPQQSEEVVFRQRVQEWKKIPWPAKEKIVFILSLSQLLEESCEEKPLRPRRANQRPRRLEDYCLF